MVLNVVGKPVKKKIKSNLDKNNCTNTFMQILVICLPNIFKEQQMVILLSFLNTL